jgi:hypothetical protein
MKTLAAVTAVVLTACSQRVYSPPSQAFGLGPVTAMSEGAQTLDVELASHSQIFDPALRSGGARLTRGIGGRTEVTGEGTAYSVAGRNIYAGRAGVRTSPGEDLALFAGAGGGYAPVAGGFTTLDAGAAVGIHNCVLVPVVQGSAFVSQPIAPRAVDVSDDDIMVTDTPATTWGATVRGGLRLSLSPSACRRGEPGSWVYAGFDITGVRDHDSDDSLFGVGLGLSIPL